MKEILGILSIWVLLFFLILLKKRKLNAAIISIVLTSNIIGIYILKRYDDAERYRNKDGDELKVDDDNIEVKEQKTTLEESDMEELIDEYQNVPYDYDETKH